MHDYKKQGRLNRASGKAFEIKVRQDLESQGWIVFRNGNDVHFINQELPDDFKGVFKQAKGKWNPFTRRPMTIQSGFPDFICIRVSLNFVQCQFIESKINGTLSALERKKCKWIMDNLNVPVLIAYKTKEKRKVKVNYWQFSNTKTSN